VDTKDVEQAEYWPNRDNQQRITRASSKKTGDLAALEPAIGALSGVAFLSRDIKLDRGRAAPVRRGVSARHSLLPPA
jgi:hypothetical protein